MVYHASPIGGLTVLEPKSTGNGAPVVWFSEKRENVLVYLSNAVEKFCRESGFEHEGAYEKWGPYGFEHNGRLRLEEYYPDALRETYQGVSGWIYTVETVEKSGFSKGIPFTVTSEKPVPVTGAEFVPDAYEAILEAEREGKIVLKRYDDFSREEREKVFAMLRREYEQSDGKPEYRYFLEQKCGICL